MPTRTAVFAGVVLVSVASATFYVRRAMVEQPGAVAGAGASLPALNRQGVTGPSVIFSRQSGLRDGKDGLLGLAPLDDLSAARFDEDLRCVRVHMSAGRGVCLERRGRLPTRYFAKLFDPSLTVTRELELAGLPSRAQVSTSGRVAAVTVFVTGHSYADGDFSTRTSIIDLEQRTWLVEDLETFATTRGGRPFRSADFNFWGVTFTRSERVFFATLGSADKSYLVRGDLDTRTLDVIAEAIECPSLSPDNRRVAFKHRVIDAFGPAGWRIWVLDLETGARHALAELRNVDDQVQWLDDAHVLYSLPGPGPAAMDTWTVPADGGGAPRLFLPSSYSAAVVRP